MATLKNSLQKTPGTRLTHSGFRSPAFTDKLRRMTDPNTDTNADMGTAPQSDTGTGAMEFKEFDELDAILEDLRTRNDETPQWEFCEGFMAALICCRRVIGASEYLPVLLDIDMGGGMAWPDDDVESDEPDDPGASDDSGEGSFADEAQLQRFMDLWVQRWNEVAEALNADILTLDDDRAYIPEVMDLKGAVAALSPEARAGLPGGEVPSYGQVWAIGFMYAVESWPEEWTPPRDKKARKLLDESLEAIIALTEDDNDAPAVCVYEEGGAPSVSKRRLNEFADAVWAVYSLRDLWQDFGERVEPVRAEAKPGRNDPCFCGSGKKFKKCHGA